MAACLRLAAALLSLWAVGPRSERLNPFEYTRRPSIRDPTTEENTDAGVLSPLPLAHRTLASALWAAKALSVRPCCLDEVALELDSLFAVPTYAGPRGGPN